jgi:uncharacterized membrane protein YhaH (DUF805 family)
VTKFQSNQSNPVGRYRRSLVSRFWLATAAAGACVIGTIAHLFSIAAAPLTDFASIRYTIYFLGIVVALYLVSLLAFTLRWRSARRSAKARNFLVCPHCRFPLDVPSVDPTHQAIQTSRKLVCSECGVATEQNQLPEYWS